MMRRTVRSAIPAGNVPRRTIVDSYILDELARQGVMAAALATDEEFLRRVYVDLAGRTPTFDETKAFLANTTSGKRDQVVDRLLGSPEFIDRWTLYFDDLFQVTASLSNVFRDTPGTLNYHNWVRESVRTQKSIAQMARELLTGSGNNVDAPTAPANFIVNANVDNGPDQDFYDKAAVNAVRTFLGNRTIDCTGCHNGRGHAEGVSLWAASRTRIQFWQIAAFFSQTTLNQPDVPMDDPHYNSFVVDTDLTGAYLLNTDYGNRPARQPAVAGADSVLPLYFNGAPPNANSWRSEFARMLVNDPQFSLSFANRLFAQIFGVGLVPAVESLDPARLDPQNPPPAPWRLQASHPDLLVRLGQELANDGYQLRPFLRMLVTSSVYQFSSQYDGNWTPANGILFERHYVKRLEPEFLADAIADVTGVPGNYTVDGLPGMLRAVQLPDISEPASDGTAYDLMFPFSRGNRENQKRNQVFSLTQQLRLMNSSFILDRLTSSPVLAGVSASSNDAAVDELFLRFLARRPTSNERAQADQYLTAAQTPDDRSQALQDLAWAILNQPDFLLLQ